MDNISPVRAGRAAMSKISAVILLQVFVAIGLVVCQGPREKKCSTTCPPNKPFETVSTTNDSSYRYIKTSTCPPYNNPNWTNPGDACLSETTYKIPLQPKVAKKPIPAAEAIRRYNGTLYLKDSDPDPILGAMGVLVNGVLVFGVGSPCVSVPCEKDGAPSNMVDAVESEGHTVDFCGGHRSPGGEYHVHSGIGFVTNSQRAVCKLPEDVAGNHSQLLGWMFDGFGLHGINSLGGVPPDDLDDCHGHSHNLSGTETYHYHLPNNTFPWTIGCYKGCPEVSNNPRELEVANEDEYGCVEPVKGGVAKAGFHIVLCILVALLVILI